MFVNCRQDIKSLQIKTLMYIIIIISYEISKKEFFGLDIDECGAGGSIVSYWHGMELIALRLYASYPNNERWFSRVCWRLGEAIMTAVGQAGIKTSNVAALFAVK